MIPSAFITLSIAKARQHKVVQAEQAWLQNQQQVDEVQTEYQSR